MPFITWSGKYSVGVPEMDDQHQRLFGILNEMHEAMKQGKGKDALGPLLGELAGYGVKHFADEEAYMSRTGHAGLAVHKSKHQDFVARVGEYQRQHADGKLALTIEVMAFLKDWLGDHILREDMAYGLR